MNDRAKVSQADKEADTAYLRNPPQPELLGPVPKITQDSRVVNGVRFFAPVKPDNVQVLVVGAAVMPEEATSLLDAGFGYHLRQKPRLMKGPVGTLLPDCLDKHHSLQSSRMGYTVLCPWLLPSSRRSKPTKPEIAWATQHLLDTVREMEPEVIVACGKVVFDVLCDIKISYNDARGCWFTHEGVPLYLIDPLVGFLTKPWSIPQFITDFREVARMLDYRNGVDRELGISKMRMRTIDTIEQLEAMVAEWEAGGYTEFSVDCEWAGNNFLEGRLRSIQFAWTPQDSCYLRFMDHEGTPVLGAETCLQRICTTSDPWGEITYGEDYVDYIGIGDILGQYLNRDGITYIAHHASADSPWMERWLELKVKGRFTFDTEFAMQAVDEYAPLGLDDLALRFTAFGRYDQELVMWKRANKQGDKDGYGKIPDDILIPYGQLDVLVVKQAKPRLEEALRIQELIPYYRTFVNPFVTDIYHDWVTEGLPVNRERFMLLRKFMNWAYERLLVDFQNSLAKQADEFMTKYVMPGAVEMAAELRDQGESAEALTVLREAASEEIPQPLKEHWLGVRSFNIRSGPQMCAWLFDVMELTPVKTTKGGEGGLPQMAWDAVLELPEALRKLAKPATDKESLEIMSAQDESGMLLKCLAVSNVGNQCKGFLKEGEVGPDGETVSENGLAKFLCLDNRLHPNYSTTETFRSRAWKPNILNLSSYHNAGVARGLIQLLERETLPPEFAFLLSDDGVLPEGMSAKDLVKKRVPSVRSIVEAPDGQCFVESDYKTAEVRHLAFKSGDPALIKLMTEPDKGFVQVADSETVFVRYRWTDDCPVAPEHRDPKFLLSKWENGKLIKQYAEHDILLRGGVPIHPPYDLHWMLSEQVNLFPREMLDEKIIRTGAKVTRFCIAEGELVLTEDCGRVPIQDVKVTSRVWDGEDWVSHGGVVCNGLRQTILYDGLLATPEHEVWINAYAKITLGQAAEARIPIWRSYPNEDWKSRLILFPFTQDLAQPGMRMTYDILDAGPKNRFMCSGVIVSNSASYGAAAKTIERRIEALTGIKPEPGMGEKLLQAYNDSQPVATQFLTETADAPRRGITLIANSGRKRRFPIHSSELQGMPWRVRKSYLRAMGNEARNFFEANEEVKPGELRGSPTYMRSYNFLLTSRSCWCRVILSQASREISVKVQRLRKRTQRVTPAPMISARAPGPRKG